jgi:hypothetical protein
MLLMTSNFQLLLQTIKQALLLNQRLLIPPVARRSITADLGPQLLLLLATLYCCP